jgi:hypothetical protein
MPKLSYKERQNLYEKIRMDDQERKGWEGLDVHITSERKHRIECFNEILGFIENEKPPQTKTINEHSGIYHLREINKTIKKLNQKVERKAICVKCGQWTLRKYAKTKNKLTYCAYCFAVCFGNGSEGWPPKISRGDSMRRLHRV